MIVPAITHYTDYRIFLQDFLKLNREENSARSQRYFSKKLGWPHSYLADVIAARKSLTLHRAIEFSKLANFDSFDTENLILLVLKESKSKEVVEYITDKLATEHNAQRTWAVDFDRSAIFETELMLIYNILKWTRRLIPPEQIMQFIYTFPDLDHNRIEEIIDRLTKMGLIKIKAEGRIEFTDSEFLLDEVDPPELGYHISQTENYLRWLGERKGPALYNSAMIQLPTGKIAEIKDKLIRTRNWLLELSKDAQKNPELCHRDNLLFQFDMNLIPLVDREAIE